MNVRELRLLMNAVPVEHDELEVVLLTSRDPDPDEDDEGEVVTGVIPEPEDGVYGAWVDTSDPEDVVFTIAGAMVEDDEDEDGDDGAEPGALAS